MLAGVVLTALYMTRQMIYVFFGDRRAAAEHAHESPPVMTVPLIVLAFCAIVFSVVLTPAWPWLHDYLSGERATLDLALLIQPGLYVALVLVAAGIGLGVLFYRERGGDRSARASAAARCSVFSKTGCGSMSFTTGRFSPSRASRRGFPIFSTAISGMAWCGWWAESASFLVA